MLRVFRDTSLTFVYLPEVIIIAERKKLLAEQQKLRKMYWFANQTTGDGQ